MTSEFTSPDPSTPPASSPPAACGVDLSGRAALVTGGGSGIGQACAAALALAGARVHVVDLDAEKATAVADAIGGKAHIADLAHPSMIDTLPSEIDILVNSAGLQHVAPLPEFPLERFALMQQVMVTAPFLLIRRVLPHMYAAGWGRVINISSVHGLRASAYKSAYVTAKHALEGLSKVTAIEGAAHGVTSNCVNPGYVRTPLVEGQIHDQAAAHGISAGDVLSDVLLSRAPVKRLLEAEEVAAAALWLCGAHTSYITGASLPLDGGWGAN
ncbi:3-hydroxybutyrate dehydrogenase [Streptomyces sp. NPDC057474]|uniref:3-hydroxybutyrate dehydrogenase n=1 Tax=Streptomyces sp. NPDC057474 TaxID=3346144 RepID=UPI0036846331